MPTSFILASNHESPLDALLLMLALKKPIRFLAAGHLFRPWWKPKTWWFWLTLKFIGQTIPTGKACLEKSILSLQKGQIVGIFPEGDVHPSLKQNRIHTGAIVLAVQAKLPIVPAHIKNSAKAWAFPAWKIKPWNIFKIRIKTGNPLTFSNIDLNNKEALQLKADNLMKQIFTL